MSVGATLPIPPTVQPSAAAPLHLMQLAARHADWAGTRQAAIASNIANADTPGYKARDIAPFEAELGARRLPLAVTRAGHMALSPLEQAAAEVDESEGWDVTHSGNTVSLDEEMMKSGQTERSHRLALSIMGSFHKMLLDSVVLR